MASELTGQWAVRWADEACHRLGLSRVGYFDLTQGCDNHVVGVNTDAGPVVLRRYVQASFESVAWEVQVLRELVRAGYPTAAVLTDGRGEAVLRIASSPIGSSPCAACEYPVVACEYVAGRPCPSDEGGLRQAARLGAWLNTVPVTAAVLNTRSTDTSRLAGCAVTTDDAHPLRRALAAAVGDLRQWDLQLAALPQGLIHRDLHPGNIVVAPQGQVRAVLDFGEAYVGPLIFELASLIQMWAEEPGGDFDPSKVSAVITAYQTTRRLTAAERKLLPLAVQYYLASEALSYLREVAEPGECDSLRRLLVLRSPGVMTEFTDLVKSACASA